MEYGLSKADKGIAESKRYNDGSLRCWNEMYNYPSHCKH